jgi:hypothetical protein
VYEISVTPTDTPPITTLPSRVGYTVAMAVFRLLQVPPVVVVVNVLVAVPWQTYGEPRIVPAKGAPTATIVVAAFVPQLLLLE